MGILLNKGERLLKLGVAIILSLCFIVNDKLPQWKKSSFKISCIVGREFGSGCKSAWIRLFAWELILFGGMENSFFLILAYVSLRQLVSNGGLPMSNVYKIQPNDQTSTS